MVGEVQWGDVFFNNFTMSTYWSCISSSSWDFSDGEMRLIFDDVYDLDTKSFLYSWDTFDLLDVGFDLEVCKPQKTFYEPSIV